MALTNKELNDELDELKDRFNDLQDELIRAEKMMEDSSDTAEGVKDDYEQDILYVLRVLDRLKAGHLPNDVLTAAGVEFRPDKRVEDAFYRLTDPTPQPIPAPTPEPRRFVPSKKRKKS